MYQSAGFPITVYLIQINPGHLAASKDISPYRITKAGVAVAAYVYR